MKLLLDENLPTKLKNSFSSNHNVLTVRDQNWIGVENGHLLKLMKQHDFEALITIDKNLGYQQNTELSRMKVIVLNAVNSKLQTLAPYVEKCEELLQYPLEESIVVVNLTN